MKKIVQDLIQARIKEANMRGVNPSPPPRGQERNSANHTDEGTIPGTTC